MAYEYWREPRGDGSGQRDLDAAHVRAAQWMLRLCQVNAGVYVKLGQHITQLQHLLPQPYVDVLKPMLREAPRSSFDAVRRVVEADLQRPLEDVFSSFDEEPIASASLAQVHRATLRDGKLVAVKVQHDGLRDTCDVDLKTVHMLVTLAAWLFPKFDYQWLSEEMALNLPLELDFRREAANCEECGAQFADDPQVVVPTIDWSHTTHRVLTMSFEEGCYVDDVETMRATGVDTAAVAQLVSRTFCAQMFFHGYVHCDPHAGNLLVRRVRSVDGRLLRQPQLVMLDHGLYRRLDDQFRLAYAELWHSIVTADEDGIKRSAEALNVPQYHLLAAMLTTRGWHAIMDPALDSLVSDPADPAARDELTTNVHEHADEIFDVLRQVPRELLLLFKLNDILRAVDRALGAPVNTHVITARYSFEALARERLRARPTLRERASVALASARLAWRVRLYTLAVTLSGWWRAVVPRAKAAASRGDP